MTEIIKMIICPYCNKNTTEAIVGICEDCFFKELKKIFPHITEVTIDGVKCIKGIKFKEGVKNENDERDNEKR